MTYNTIAIILSRRPVREADLLVNFFSRDFGRQTGLAVGARKIQGKLASLLEPFREVKLMLAQGREINKIGQVVSLNNFFVQAPAEPLVLEQAQQAAALVERLLPPGQKEPAVYELLKQFLSLNFNSPFQADLFSFFCLKLLDLNGLSAELNQCLRCHQPLKPVNNHFDFLQGGILCPNCRPESAVAKTAPITVEAIKVWRYLRSHSLEKLCQLKISSLLSQELKNLVDNFLIYQT